MSVLKSSSSENESPRSKLHEDEIRLLWDGILDILLERIHQKSISLAELSHLIHELDDLMRAIKGKDGVWGSVVDVAVILLKRDVSICNLRAELCYNESTIYRALNRLEAAKIAKSIPGEGLATLWTINDDQCPVLYRASRP